MSLCLHRGQLRIGKLLRDDEIFHSRTEEDGGGEGGGFAATIDGRLVMERLLMERDWRGKILAGKINESFGVGSTSAMEEDLARRMVICVGKVCFATEEGIVSVRKIIGRK